MKNMDEEETFGKAKGLISDFDCKEGCFVFVYEYLTKLSTASVKRVGRKR